MAACGIDTFARVLAQEINRELGWRFVVENRAGAASLAEAPASAVKSRLGDA